MTSFTFHKMHSLQNDFMVIDFTQQNKIEIAPNAIKALSDRKTGVGFDQLLLIEPPTDNKSDFRYLIFNADGSQSEQCGNGACAITKYLIESKLHNGSTIQFETLNGQFSTTYKSPSTIEIMLPPPSFSPKSLPSTLTETPYTFNFKEEEFTLWLVSVGNPHGIIFGDINKRLMTSIATFLKKSTDLFPQGINLSFCHPISRSEALLTVYERGVGFTDACGSGACATFSAGKQNDLFDNTATIKQTGGNLTIHWNGKKNSAIKMIGTAFYIYEGYIHL